jgi:hypothetical protein
MRLVGLVSGSLALLACLLLASLTIWLQSRSGRGWIERALAREAKQRLALTLTVGRVTGNLIGGIRLERVVLRDAHGQLVARADTLSARYRLPRLVRDHEVDEITVVRPVIARLPSTGPARSHGEPTRFSVRELTISDGSFAWDDHDVQHLGAHAQIDWMGDRVALSATLHGIGFDARAHGAWADGQLTATVESLELDPKRFASADPWAGRGVLHAHGTLVGPLDALDLELRGHTTDRGFAAGGQLNAERRSAVLRASIASAASELGGAARIHARHLDATGSGRISPAEAAALGIEPTAPLRLRVSLCGPPRAVAVRIDGRLRAARVRLAGRVDLPARRGRVRFVAQDVRPSQIDRRAPELAVSGLFTFRGGLDAHAGLAGQLSVTDGNLRVGGRQFERLHGTGRVRLAATGEARVETLSGRIRAARPRPFTLATAIHWDPRALRFDADRVVVEDNRAAGTVVYTRDLLTRQPLVTVRARSLSLSPSLIEETFHQRPVKAWPGNAYVVWTPNGTGVLFALHTGQGRLAGAARLRPERAGLELPSVELALKGSHLRGAARVRNDELVASVDELALEPALVNALLPPLNPALPLHFQGALAGPLHALDLQLIATSGPSTVLVAGRVDARAGSFRLRAALDNFQMARSRSSGRVTLQLSLLGRFVPGGVAGTLTVRHASGVIQGLPLVNARLDATLDGPRFHVDEVLLGVPGGVVQGKGGGSYRDFRIGYGVVITDALQLRKVPKSLRLMIGVTALTPGRSVVGAVQRHDGGDIQLTHRTIPPPFRVVNLLYHVIKGDRLHLSVR